MFVVATDSPDFTRDWSNIFNKRGGVAHVRSLDELRALLLSASPTLVMIDLTLPGTRDPSLLRSLQLACKKGKMLLGGIAFEPSSELAGLAVGASACLDVSLPLDECEKIIDVVLQGGIWLSSASIPFLVGKLQNFPASQVTEQKRLISQPSPAIAEEDFRKLTRREREVAQLVSNGANNKTIARQLLITDRTVKAHLTSIFDKLKVSDRLQLALGVSARESAQEPN
jgi:two-component system, NarL family, nitrate/nitrite response regulator NarL